MEPWVTANQFIVMFGPQVYGFSRISNLETELEYDSVTEGGKNWSPLLLQKSGAKQAVITFERGAKTEWTRQHEIKIRTGTILSAVIILVMMDHKICRKFTFDKGVVTKLQFGDLNALGNEILIEKMEVAHTGLQEIKV